MVCLRGTLPTTIGALQNLTSLRITLQSSSCAEPSHSQLMLSDALTELQNLETLVLSANELLGSIPKDIGSLASLRILRLASVNRSPNALKGFFPSSFCNLTRLEDLTLLASLEGFSDPSCLHWPNLEILMMSSCTEFRWSLTNLNSTLAPHLKRLDVSNTKVSGSLHGIATLTQLETINLGSLSRIKFLPPEFWNLERLDTILISDTLLYGEIGPGIGRMSRLKTLWLDHTKMSGTIPSQIGNCTALETISISHSPLRGPFPSSMSQLINLRSLRFHGLSRLGELPEWVGNWTQMNNLVIASSGLNGTIPHSITTLPLTMLDLSSNYLTQSIPEGLKVPLLSLNNNLMQGSIPLSLLSYPDPERVRIEMDLSNNRFGRRFNRDFFAKASEFTSFRLDFSNNNFHTRLPSMNLTRQGVYLRQLILSNNRFYGPIPPGYSSLYRLHLDRNLLDGDIDFLLNSSSFVAFLRLEDNLFAGTVPNFTENKHLQELDLSQNLFSGRVPSDWSNPTLHLPPALRRLSLSNVSLTGNIPLSFARAVYQSPVITHLDLSHNNLTVDATATLPLLTYGNVITHLDLSFNRIKTNLYSNVIGGELESFVAGVVPQPSKLTSLVLSSNLITIPDDVQPELASLNVLKLDKNRLYGSVPQFTAPFLQELNLAHNNLSQGLSSLQQFPRLAYLNISHNQMTGSLDLLKFVHVQTVDMETNYLDVRPSLADYATSYTRLSLISLNIAKNPNLPTFDEIPGYLNRTSSSYPSQKLRGVTCYSLAFNGLAGRLFLTDESLFQYLQCDCDDKNFGLPSRACLECPSLASAFSTCRRQNLDLNPNYFLFQNQESKESSSRLEAESCMHTLRQEISGVTNCLGLKINAGHVLNTSTPFDGLLKTQCATGSEGRLCSKCQCNAEKCYFLKHDRCTKCLHVFRLSTSLPLLLAGVSVIIAVLSIIFLLVLRSKRTPPKQRDWTKLPLAKRIFQRFLYLTTLGTLPILVTFVQILLELTHWNWYALQGMLQLANGNSLGFECFFPAFSDPTSLLIIKLCLPLVFLAIFALAVGIAELLSRKCKKGGKAKRSQNSASASSSAEQARLMDGLSSLEKDSSHWHSYDDLNGLDDDNEEFSPNMELLTPSRTAVHAYPATALLSSVSISVLKFFYFGTALAAHEYLFYTLQPHTAIKYAQQRPWMKYSEAFGLIMISAPSIIVFDLVIPLSFAYLCYRVRGSQKSLHRQTYFGSLFQQFAPECFWWEIVNILRKLSIALVRQGYSDSNALQPMLVTTCLLGVLVIQATLQPWRRKIENVTDSISAVLLLGSMLASRSGPLSNSSTTIYFCLALDVVFVIFCVGSLVFESVTGKTDYQALLEQQPSSNFPSLNYTELIEDRSEVLEQEDANVASANDISSNQHAGFARLS